VLVDTPKLFVALELGQNISYEALRRNPKRLSYLRYHKSNSTLIHNLDPERFGQYIAIDFIYKKLNDRTGPGPPSAAPQQRQIQRSKYQRSAHMKSSSPTSPFHSSSGACTSPAIIRFAICFPFPSPPRATTQSTCPVRPAHRVLLRAQSPTVHASPWNL
jgi:hypothetical protein